ncbi:MAG TPA: hypothetical protein VMZ30_16300 [Pyrinomonadaceae bacterium]|nr:hypothetical protein [Pyrinomonadaceae bacterium]
MEANTTDRHGLELPLGEPHFDEEATLLSAQPVVPLEEIAAEQRSGRWLAFGVAMAISLVLGALGGTLIYRQRGHQQPTAIIDTAVPGAEGITADEPVVEPSVAEAIAEAGTGTLPDSSGAPAITKSAPSRPRGGEPLKVEVREKKLPNVTGETELRRAERIEARQLRRKSERQAQKAARRYGNRSDDVLRIREIFEGSPRP